MAPRRMHLDDFDLDDFDLDDFDGDQRVMIDAIISERITSASWRGALLWFVALAAFSYWAFNTNSPWTEALAAGDGVLPEMLPGFPPVEPARTLETLGNGKRAYLLWQFADIPFATLNTLLLWSLIGLGLKGAGLAASPLRYAMAAPLAYGLGEVVENSFLTAFALDAAAPYGWSALIQQAATTVKHTAAFGAGALALVCLGLAGVFALLRRMKKNAG
ncbi:MAG: hypothetical protein AAF224_02110 [Pseudomonadota bacterium]